MITLAWYLLKVIICSGILCGYYFLALRNKAFHRWNRFYILAAIVISLLVPIMKINIFQNGEDKGTVVQVLQTISYGDEAVIEYSHNSDFQLSTENLIEGSFLLISAIFLFIFLHSLYKIKRLRKKYPETRIEDVSFINTDEKGTPFSFFNSIFWNQAIDLHSKSGQQIFNHEIAHVKEKHSYDKIFMNIVLIFFWINPFFWLMRKELYMIHEFIADKEALEDSDISSFAEMILQTVYPGQHFSSINPFFYSPIKRRILMLTKNKHPKVSYISRLLVLPLATIVFFGFTLKVKNTTPNLYDGKTINVVIDAGHGGTDNGAVSANGVKEKDITLAIAKKIARLNSNAHIQILLSRKDDETIPVKDRVVFAESNKADLFISISDQEKIAKNILDAINKYVLSSDKIDSGDSIAIDSHEPSTSNISKANDTVPAMYYDGKKVKNLSVQSKSKSVKVTAPVIKVTYDDGNTEMISKEEADKRGFVLPPAPPELPSSEFKSNALFVIDGKISTNDKANTVDPKSIESINVLKGEAAIKKYGDKGKSGVIEIITKKDDYSVIGNSDTIYIRGSSSKPISQNSKNTAGVVYINETFPDGALILADGKEISQEEMKNIPPNNIQSVNILKGETAIKKYGEKAKEGAIEITTKHNIPPNTLIIIDGKKNPQEMR